MRLLRTKGKCKVCRAPFEKRSSQHVCCSMQCAIENADRVKAKRERQDKQARIEKLKTASDYRKEAQIAFNAYIRERDKDQPCISCGAMNVANHLTGGSWDCGHYRSTGAAPHLRFDERNAHKQCKRCNRDLAGNVVEYRKGLVRRIGAEAVEALEADQAPRKYSAVELKALRDKYRAKLRELKAENKRRAA